MSKDAANGRERAAAAGTAVESDCVAKSYGARAALSNCSVTVRPGEVVALEGPSGGGKSTLLRLLCGLEQPDSGTVRAGLVELSSLNEGQRAQVRRETFGLVLQFGGLVPDLPLRENVALPLLLSGMGGRLARQKSDEMLDEVGLAGLGKRFPADVSGGEAQRAAVARALVHDPAVVLADEPTGALDSANADIVLRLILDCARTRNASVLIATHDAWVAAAADRRVRLIDGVTVDN